MSPSRLAAISAAHGPEAIAFYLSGQLLTEDYYVANKLAKGFIGTPHVDTNSRLCMASSVAGHRRAFGADVVPQCYDDLELADLVVLAGSNAAWCHPILYQRIQTARAERGVRVVNIDPRRTATSEGADLQLSIKPGTDAHAVVRACWCGWPSAALIDRTFIDAAHAKASPRRCGARARIAPTLAAVAARDRPRQRRTSRCSTTGSPARRASSPATARASTSRRRAPTRSTPSSTATWPRAASASRAPGRCRSPASPTPWAGARSAGSPTCWPRTWASRRPSATACAASGTRPTWSRGEGLKAVAHVRRRRRRPHQGAVGDGHQPGGVAAARRRGARGAGQARAARRVGERRLQRHASRWRTCGCRPRPGARRTARSPTPSGASRASARSCRLPARRGPTGGSCARWRGGWAAARRSPIARAAEIFDEHARLSGFENDGDARLRHLRRRRASSEQAYDAPRALPVAAPRADAAPTRAPVRRGRFFTPDRKARFVAIAPPRLAAPVSDDWPFVLNTGRVRDQWHTMTRTGLSPRLSDAHRRAVRGDPSRRCGAPGPGAGHAGAVSTRSTARPSCACWSTAASSRARCSCRSTGRPRTARAGRIGALVQPATDPVLRPARGQGDAGAHRAAAPCRTTASLLSRRPLRPPASPIGRSARTPSGTCSTSRSTRRRDGLARVARARRCPRASA